MARLQAQDPAGAARILEAVTAREPANTRAWRLLGVAYQRGKEIDKALTTYRKALDALISVLSREGFHGFREPPGTVESEDRIDRAVR